MSRQPKIGERLPYLLSALKAPRIGERLAATAERAREEQWAYEQFLEVLLEAAGFAGGERCPYERSLGALGGPEVFPRGPSGPRQPPRHAGFPAHKTLEDF